MSDHDTPFLRLGDSVGHPRSTLGTLGWFAWRAGKIGFASITSALAPAGEMVDAEAVIEPTGRRAAWVHSPGSLESEQPGPATRVANLSAFDQWIAFAELLPHVEWEGNVVEGKRITEISPSPTHGAQVSKLGAKTGLTKNGRIGAHSIYVDVSIGDSVRRLADVVEVVAEADAFCEPGDGGGLVFMPDSLEAVGIIVGATYGARKPQIALVMPLPRIMQRFGLTLDAEGDAIAGAKRVLRHMLLDNRWKFRTLQVLARAIDDKSEGYLYTKRLLRELGARHNVREGGRDSWALSQRRAGVIS